MLLARLLAMDPTRASGTCTASKALLQATRNSLCSTRGSLLSILLVVRSRNASMIVFPPKADLLTQALATHANHAMRSNCTPLYQHYLPASRTLQADLFTHAHATHAHHAMRSNCASLYQHLATSISNTPSSYIYGRACYSCTSRNALKLHLSLSTPSYRHLEHSKLIYSRRRMLLMQITQGAQTALVFINTKLPASRTLQAHLFTQAHATHANHAMRSNCTSLYQH